MIELTCPAEEGIEAAKETRYQKLQVAVKAWGECKYFTVEVGARGLVGLRVHKVLLRLAFAPMTAKSLCQKLSEVVARALYAIYLARSCPGVAAAAAATASLQRIDEEEAQQFSALP